MAAMHARHLWLALILLIYLVLATLYAVNVPAWQAPDEPAHFNYIHELAATGQFPVLRMGDYDQAYLERLTGEGFPPELSLASLRYEAHQPPLYYLLGAGVLRLTGGELLPLRLLSVALGALFIVLIYATVRLIFPDRPALALGAAAFTAFLPMHVAQAASVNNDALAEVLLAMILLFSIRYVKLAMLGPRSPAPRDALAIGLLLGLALVTKVSAYVAIPIALAAPLIARHESRRSPVNHSPIHHSPINHYGLILLPALLIALPWYVRNAQVYGNLDILARSWHDQVVVGQLTTGELLAQTGLAAVLERFLVWSHSSFWGVFGWMGVWMDARVYTAAFAFGVAVVVGCVAAVRNTTADGEQRMAVGPNTTTDGEQRMAEAAEGADLAAPFTVQRSPFNVHRSRFRRWALALLALSALGTLGIYVAYNLQFVQPQGRYLFPALPFVSLAVAVGWWTVARWPAAARWAGIALLGAAGVAVLWGVTQEGINTWSLLIFGGGAAWLWAWSLVAPQLEDVTRELATRIVYALPFAAMALLSLLALWVFVLPQLA
jgi:4-amino-4-deoxy-L-arabinose transferase-like glycosyltransferase